MARDSLTKKAQTRSAMRRGASLPALAAAAMLGGTMTAAFLTAGFAQNSVTAETYDQLDLFGTVLDMIHDEYVENPDDAEMIEGAINGMLQSLDPHSSYLDVDSYRTMREQTQGSFFGLGIQVVMENEGPGRGLVKVVSPIDGTPAFRAGLKPNDLVYEIDGEPVFGMTLSEAIAEMKGPRGTTVDLTIIREDEPEPLDFTIERDDIEVNPVTEARLERDDIAYIRVASFTQKTEAKMLEAIDELSKESGGLQALVLDMRGNPGGLLDQAIKVSDAFLEGGEIVSTRGRRAKDSSRALGKGGDVLSGKPIIVLINEGSASASEIVAGALQDRGRALLLGTKSFGKGSVQTLLELPGEEKRAIRLTTARYYTPSGRSIQAQGIVPDIVMPITREGEDEPRRRRSEADLRGALDVPEETEVTVTDSDDEETLTNAQQILADGQAELRQQEAEEGYETALFVEPVTCPLEEDCQLNRALDILEAQGRYGELLADASAIDRTPTQ